MHCFIRRNNWISILKCLFYCRGSSPWQNIGVYWSHSRSTLLIKAVNSKKRTSATFVQKVSSDNCEPQGCLCRHYIGFASVWRVPSVVYLRVCCLQGRFASPASIARIPNAFLHDLWIQALHSTVETLAIRRMMFGKCALEHARFKCSSLTHCSRLQKTQCVKPPQSSATTRFI